MFVCTRALSQRKLRPIRKTTTYVSQRLEQPESYGMKDREYKKRESMTRKKLVIQTSINHDIKCTDRRNPSSSAVEAQARLVQLFLEHRQKPHPDTA